MSADSNNKNKLLLSAGADLALNTQAEQMLASLRQKRRHGGDATNTAREMEWDGRPLMVFGRDAIYTQRGRA